MRSALAGGKIEVRKYTVTFDPSTIRVLDSKFKADAKVMFEIAFTGRATKGMQAPSAPLPAARSAAPDRKFCKHCGTELEADASFCYKCGEPQ